MIELDMGRATKILREMQSLRDDLEKKREELIQVAMGKKQDVTDKDIEDILAFTSPPQSSRSEDYQPRGLNRSQRKSRTRRGTEEMIEWLYYGREYYRIARSNDLGTPDICRRKGRRISCVWLTVVECQLIREQTYKRRFECYKRRIEKGETNVILRPCIAAAAEKKSHPDEG